MIDRSHLETGHGIRSICKVLGLPRSSAAQQFCETRGCVLWRLGRERHAISLARKAVQAEENIIIAIA